MHCARHAPYRLQLCRQRRASDMTSNPGVSDTGAAATADGATSEPAVPLVSLSVRPSPGSQVPASRTPPRPAAYSLDLPHHLHEVVERHLPLVLRVQKLEHLAHLLPVHLLTHQVHDLRQLVLGEARVALLSVDYPKINWFKRRITCLTVWKSGRI